MRYCARPPLSADRLEQLNESTLVYHLRKPTLDGHTELILKPIELLERLSKLITPPRIHKHRYCGVLAPNARLRRAVIASAGSAGATRQLLQQATDKMQLPGTENRAHKSTSIDAESPSNPPSAWRRTAAHCWALLLVRIYECLPLICPRCGEAMRIVAFIQEPQTIERILRHIGEPNEAPQVLPARAPPQHMMEFDQSADVDEWPDVDQTAGDSDDFVE